MKIAVTGGKGGTGKSFVATSLAVEFARTKKTMLVDVDVECPNDHLLLSIKRKEREKAYQSIPEWDFSKCTKCGLCAKACKQDAIVFVKGRYPAFSSDKCTGCMACMSVCPVSAITETKKQIGTIYTGSNYGVELVSGELKIGELASGEVVNDVRKYADSWNTKVRAEITLIDSAAGIGCPVISSLVGTDFIVAVTEPTPSALHDLKRVLYLSDHFNIKRGIVINKHDLDRKFSSQLESFAKKRGIPVLGKIPYKKDFLKSSILMKPVSEIHPEYRKTFSDIISRIFEVTQQKDS